MPRIGVSITKNTAFRGTNQEFSNVYYFEVSGVPSVAQADTIIDNLVTLEKTIHSTGVTFIRGRLWTETGNKATNEMISQKNLAGTGARITVTNLDKERAFLVRLRAGVDSRGNPVYLRKWFHACGAFYSGQGVTTGQMENTASLSSADKTAIVNAVAGIGDANGSPLTPKLCSKNGRLPNVGATWESHNWIEHHQLGDMWRAN
jgi:hypothetical protein